MKVNKVLKYIFASAFLFGFIHLYAADNGTEFGVADDLTVLGIEGTKLDPDVEIKGFTVFGSTQSSYTADIPQGPGNVIVNGILGVSSGAYITGVSTFAYISSITIKGAASIYIMDGNTDQVLAKDANGYLKWVSLSDTGGDSLGSHIATKTLDMSGYDITKIKEMSLGTSGNIKISTATTQFGGVGAGVLISTHVELSGQLWLGSTVTVPSAASLKFSDGSQDQLLMRNADGTMRWVNSTSLGDNLGNHIATKTLDMSGYDITKIKEMSLGTSGNIKISTATTQFGGVGAGVLISTNTQVSGDIYVNGNAVLNSNLNINGNLTIGDNTSDMVYINSSDIRYNSITATSGSNVSFKDNSGNLVYYIRKK